MNRPSWLDCDHDEERDRECLICGPRRIPSAQSDALVRYIRDLEAHAFEVEAECKRLRDALDAERCRPGAGLPGWEYIAQHGVGLPLWRRLPRLYTQAGFKRHEGWTWTVFADDARTSVLASGRADTAMDGMRLAEAVAREVKP